MANGVMPYLISWEKLQGFWGKQDQALIKRMIDNHSGKIKGFIKLFRDTKPNNIGEYIADIINGHIQHKNGALYGYALEMLIVEEGRLVNNSEWYPAANWYDFSSKLPDDLPFQLPFPEDFPDYKVIAPASAGKAAAIVEKTPSITQPQKEQFLHWLKRAGETSRALVLFYY